MNFIRNLTLTLAISAAGAAWGISEKAPDILFPRETGAGVIQGMSNNGKYGVASVNPEADGFSYTVGAFFYDLTGSTPVGTDIGKGHSSSGASDVTDDGLTVVGSVDRKPAVCRYKDGKWTWEYLPIPEETVEIPMEDMYTGEQFIGKFSFNGGHVNAVTPDGRYAVGIAACNENEMLEKAVMWDLTAMKLVDVPFPETDRTGNNENQSRFIQISDDGRYLLCWNSFSYMGSLVFVFDRQKNEAIYIDVEKNGGTFTPRVPGYEGIELDGISKSLTSNGRYVGGGISKGDQTYVFRFDIQSKELKIYDDGIHDDVTGWTVTKEGLALGATPSTTLYADALICTDTFLYPFETIYKDVYGMNLELLGIDNTGKPTLVSDDGRTIVFVTGRHECYLARFKEDLTDAIDRINLMSSWSVSPVANTKMSKLETVSFTFDNPVEADASRSASITLADDKGNVVATPLASGGIQTQGMRLILNFEPLLLDADKTYTLSVPEGVCWVSGHKNSVNNAMQVKYVGRANRPVKAVNVSPSSGTALSSIDLNDNPVVVTFDAAVKINGTADNRPVAHLYIDEGEESAASLAMDVDLNTNKLVIYPASAYYLYKGSEYKIKVPAGAVTDVSGMGPSEAFEISYTGTYVPELGDEKYLFRSTCDDFSKFLFYEGDNGTPTSEYASMGFTQKETPWWVVMDEGVEDMAFASHSSYTDGRQADDWFAIRQLNIPEDTETYLSFQGQSYRKSKNDVLKIYIYEDRATINQLTSSVVSSIRKNGDLVFEERLSPGATEINMKDEWTDYVVPLDKYKGKSIYICFVNENKSQSMIMVDNIEVVKNVDAFVTVTTSSNVVNQKSVAIKGILSIASELADYSAVSLTLMDEDGREVSSLSESGLNLKSGDTYNFEFPKELPLTVGSENPYTIRYILDGETSSVYEGVIRDLAFQTTKRVVLEEYTGRDCQFCPLGMAAIERLESLYGESLIPVALHAYNGSDPKGANILGYAASVFQGNTAAPSGRINRRPDFTSPMASDTNKKYHMTASELPPGAANLWQDELVTEFGENAILDVDAHANAAHPGFINYTVKVKPALNLTDQNIRVLGVVLEDNIVDSQTNGIFMEDDPLIGEFGKGGLYGKATFYYYFNNVARGYWGQSANGTPRLIPATLESGKEYEVTVNQNISGIVDKPENVKMAIILIDGNTNRVINACVAKADISGVDGITDDSAAEISIGRLGSEIVVECSSEVNVAVYALDGRQLAGAGGQGSLSISLDGYKGVVIVNAVSNGTSTSKKLIM